MLRSQPTPAEGARLPRQAAVAFASAFLLMKAIRLSGSPRGAQLLALGTAGAIQGVVLASSLTAYGFGRQTLLILVVSTLFTGLGWSRFRRAFPEPPGSRPTPV